MTTLLEYKIEKTKHGVKVVHNGRIVHETKNATNAQKWIEQMVHESIEGKYGDVDYADKKNKKYPVDTEEHIRAAWDYINVAKNAADEDDVEAVKNNIIKAWKEKISKSGPPSAQIKEGKTMNENFMDAILAQDYVSAETAFKKIMAEKASEFMEHRKQEIAATMTNESVKLQHEYKSDCGNHCAKVYKNSDLGEHQVKFFTNGKYHTDADYYTDDKDDAHSTAKHQLKTMENHKKD
jgi:hypothetical protein